MIAMHNHSEIPHYTMYHRTPAERSTVCPPGSSGHHQSVSSPTTRSSADEVDAIAALISMPSFGTESSVSASSPSPREEAHKPTYQFCMETPSSGASAFSPVPRHRHSSSFSSTSTVSSVDSSFYGTDQHAGPWYTGSVSLALPEDEDVLSPLHCFMRKYCVEAFSATIQDIATPRYGKSHGGKIVVGQVGIQCLHCKHLTRNRPERAVCYPSSLRNIYHSIETWQRRHALVCTEIPGWVQKEMTVFMKSSRISAGGRRQYWEDAAKQLGMIDTPQGVRFARPPGMQQVAGDRDSRTKDPESISDSDKLAGKPVVGPTDKDLITDYLFVLMNQMQVCRFTEEDRTGGRSKVKDFAAGYPGMQCKHCCGKAGFGRYFPSSVDALALANSDRNIYNHLLKCRRCPESIKLQLKAVRPESTKNKRGSRKLFFARVWDRIHDEC